MLSLLQKIRKVRFLTNQGRYENNPISSKIFHESNRFKISWGDEN